MTGNSTWIDLPKIYTPKLMPGISLAEIDHKMIEAAKGIEDWINTNMSAKVSVQWMNLPDPEENPRGMFGWFRIFRDFEDSLKIPTNEQMRVRSTEQVSCVNSDPVRPRHFQVPGRGSLETPAPDQPR